MSSLLLSQSKRTFSTYCLPAHNEYTLAVKVSCNGISGKQLAELTKVSIRTVEDWRRRNQGPAYQKLANGEIRYPLEDVIEFIKEYRGCTLILEYKHEK